MPHLSTDDGVRLHYEEAGTGTPIVFVHEFAGDHRSFEPQMRFFARRYRCIAYNARGYEPSDVPAEQKRYSQDRARDDLRSVLDALGIAKAHVVGVSMGASASLHFGLRYPDRALSLVVAGVGTGSVPGVQAQFRGEVDAMAKRVEAEGMAAGSAAYAESATRVQYQNKDPRGWAEFARFLAEHSTLGSTLTLRGVQRDRPSLYDAEGALRQLTVPMLLVVGDEDEPCLDPSLFLKRTVPSAALVTLPRTGHAVNLEEPALFNQFCADFFHAVEAGRWTMRDERATARTIMPTR
jgi:pimeloyl-ACP methyl ester carboxylesterase